MADTHEHVVRKLVDLYHMLVCHNGFGEMSVDIRILKRGQKEVILRCGKQYRFVVDTPGQGAETDAWLFNWKHGEDEDSPPQPSSPSAGEQRETGGGTPAPDCERR